MSTSCKYCSKPENKQDNPGLVCETCVSFVHLTCLRRPGTPGDFACDVFFDFTCEECSPHDKETFIRNRMTWLTVIFLSLYHLNTKSYGISNNGFFHYKTHICYFIDRNWQLLFGIHKQKKNWMGTIAGALSVYSNMFFKSGSIVLGETGWWKLRHAFSPAVAAHIVQEVPRDKQNGRPRKLMSIERALFITKITEMGYKDLMNEFDDVTPMDPVPRKKRRVDSDELSGVSSTSVYDHLDSDSRNETVDECADDDLQAVLRDGYSDAEIAEGHFTHPGHSDSSSVHSIQQSLLYYDSDSRSGSPHIEDYAIKTSKTKSTTVEEKPIVLRESLFSTELNSVDMPWVEDPVENKDLVEMTLYEEVQLLKHVDNMIPKMRDLNKKAHLSRLKANLSLRRLKAHKHLPVFDFDKTVKLLGGYMTEDPRVVMNAERILDRFQRSYLIDNLCGTIASTNYGTLILSHIEPTPFRSAFSGTTLKPYIRRDADSSPLWLKLTDELLRKTNKHIVDYSPPPHATVDYSYLRPQHIAAVNNLCAQFFWPGIDLTEALQYPEFSCVVTYKRLVVGCAFLVPDVRHNEAYISFVLTRPEWRNAKIGSFMLYHLLQTCSGKDVTLHVSPANPAIFLYQKFGFKVEELIQDFYEKYYDIDYKGCRHALFLRLVR